VMVGGGIEDRKTRVKGAPSAHTAMRLLGMEGASGDDSGSQ
jgi:hypothetical protein